MFFSASLRRTFIGAAALQGEHKIQITNLRNKHKRKCNKQKHFVWVCVFVYALCQKQRMSTWALVFGNNKIVSMTSRFVAKILLRINVKNEWTARGRANGGSSLLQPYCGIDGGISSDVLWLMKYEAVISKLCTNSNFNFQINLIRQFCGVQLQWIKLNKISWKTIASVQLS